MAKARSSKSASSSNASVSLAATGAPAAAMSTSCCGTATMEPPAKASAAGKFSRCCQPSYEQISQRAHQIWVEKGRPVGLDLENWKQAEAELTSAA